MAKNEIETKNSALFYTFASTIGLDRLATFSFIIWDLRLDYKSSH